MYSIKPYIDWNSKVELPTCMYGMKPLYTLTHAPTGSSGSGSATSINTSVQQIKPNSDSVLEIISKRQDQLLMKLNLLKLEVEKLLVLSNIKKPVHKIEIKKTHAIPQQSVVPKKIIVQNKIVDIVINVHPSQLPTSLFIIKSFLSSHYPVLVSSIVHSSAKDIVSPKVKNLLGSSGSLCSDRNFYKYGLTFIWKKDKNLPSMIISPTQHIPVVGEYNIARYLDRLLPSGGYESFGNVVATIADELIDNAASFRKTGFPELQSIIKALEKQLSGKQKFIVAEVVTLVDIILWSLIFSTKGCKEKLTNNVKKWFDQCSVLPEFKNVS